MPDLPEPETVVIDTDLDQGSDTETINYIEDKHISEMIPETSDEQQAIPQEGLDSLTRIYSARSPPPQGDELLPERNQANECETIINDANDDDIDFTISRTTN